MVEVGINKKNSLMRGEKRIREEDKKIKMWDWGCWGCLYDKVNKFFILI